MNKKFLFVIIGLLAFGLYVRIHDLHSHFSTYDDLAPAAILLKMKGVSHQFPRSFYEPAFYFSIHNTNGPLQFLITTHLINADLNYRELLFWNRFPAFLFSFLTLPLFLFFLSKFYSSLKKHDLLLYQSTLALGLVMVGFSWINVIYSKFAVTYAIGPFFLVALMAQLNYLSSNARISFVDLSFTLVVLILSLSANYQIFLFLPGLGLAVLWVCYQNMKTKSDTMRLAKYIGFLAFIFLFFLRWFWNKFVAPFNSTPIAGERGLNDMFLLGIDSYEGVQNKVVRVLEFFPLNFGRMMGSNFSYTFDGSNLAIIFSTLCGLFMIAGFYHLVFYKKDLTRRAFAVFLLVTICVWFYFIYKGKMSLSPTRHQMILIPLMVLLVLEGIQWFQRWRKSFPFLIYLPLTLGIVFFSSFSMSFPSMSHDRQDFIDESKLISLFEQHHVDLVYQVPNMLNLAYMKQLTAEFPVFTGIWLKMPAEQADHNNKKIIALVSQGEPHTEEEFNNFVEKYNVDFGSPLWLAKLSDYEEIFYSFQDGINMDYSHYSRLQKNALRITILKKKN